MPENTLQDIIQRMMAIIEGENWLGENFRKKIDALTDEMAFHQSMPHIHSVAELISHLTVWKAENINKLLGNPAEMTMDSPENWKANETLTEIGWLALKREFYATSQRLIDLIKDKPETFLLEFCENETHSNGALLEGLIQHDIYHLGQIGITVKLSRLNKYRRFLN